MLQRGFLLEKSRQRKDLFCLRASRAGAARRLTCAGLVLLSNRLPPEFKYLDWHHMDLEKLPQRHGEVAAPPMHHEVKATKPWPRL